MDERRSTPTLSEFDPSIIPFQKDVLKLIRKDYDYNQGGLEILLSGSVGCLREDAKVMTAFGEVPISDITQQDYLPTYHEKSGRFGLSLNSGAFPKAKGSLYRVVGEHGEFVASGNHLLSTSLGIYERIDALFSRSPSFESLSVHYQTNQAASQKALTSGVLNCFETIVNLINHCVERIHQCGQQLPVGLVNALDAFPLTNDAQEFGLFFYNCKPLHEDVLKEQALKHAHNAESPFLLSMRDLFHLLVNKIEVLGGACIQVYSVFCEHTLKRRLQSLLFQTHNAHPQDLLLFLSKFLLLLSSSIKPPTIRLINNKVTIEKLNKEDWYWDLKVPNTHNYISNGFIHHNSAKSLLMAHIAVTHCLMYERSRFLLGRQSMPDLKSTLIQKILEHMEGTLVEGEDFYHNKSTGYFYFYATKSEIISRSWGDKNFERFRSLEISGFAIEELTENKGEYWGFYKELFARLGRLPHVPENIAISATNPDAPSHPAYKHFIENENTRRKVFYSLTEQNPFLPKWYIEQLKETFTEKEARRMLFGEWIEIAAEVIYYAYDDKLNLIQDYKINQNYPIIICYDFNIGLGKPMSSCAMQHVDGKFYIFDENIINGANTQESIDEWVDKGIFGKHHSFVICGDATGYAKTTKYNKSDYDIIERTLIEAGVSYKIDVKRSNPPVRKRHIVVNGQLCNANGERRVFVHKGCSVVREGLRQTRLKKGSSYIEDDSDHFQHVTTALGYGIIRQIENQDRNFMKRVRF